MRRLLLAVTALALTSCAGGEPTAEPAQPTSARHYGEPNAEYTFFRWATPPSIVSAGPANEFSIRMRAALPGRIMGLRFYRPPGSTENVRMTVRSASGDSAKITLPGGVSAGWQWRYLGTAEAVYVSAGENFSVFATVTQTLGKTPGLFAGGPVVKDMLTADIGSSRVPGNPPMYSYDAYFVDVLFWPEPA